MTQKIMNEGKLANNSSAPKIQTQKAKEKSIAISKIEADHFSQIIASNGQDATQKFNQISKGKCVSKTSNDNRDQMDVDRAMESHFEEEILMDILSRLPVRSLLRFKCVAKFWKRLISEPYFKMKHLNRAKNDQDSQKLLISQMCIEGYIFSMFCCPLSRVQPVEDVQKLDCPSNPKSLLCTIHCCYDGLVVIEIFDNMSAKNCTLLLWNPSTRESIVLPSLEFPQNGTSHFGLGYDSTSGEYKILLIHSDFGSYKKRNEILALKGCSWRRIDGHPCASCSSLFDKQFLAFVHGTFHWIGISSYVFVLVSFSISNEVYGEIPLPDVKLSLWNHITIGTSVLRGMLCIHTNSLCGNMDSFKLWVLKEYGVKESWISLLTIQDPWISHVVPKYWFADGEVLFKCWSSSAGSVFRTPSEPFVPWPRCEDSQDGHAYTESLISPKSLTN